MEPSVDRAARAVIRNLWIVIALGLIAAIGSYAYARWLAPERYEARTTLITGQPNADGGSLDHLRISQAAATTYAALAEEPLILDAVSAELGLGESATKLARSLRVTAEPNARLIEVVAIRDDKGEAQAIAQQVADTLVLLQGPAPDNAAIDAQITALQMKIAAAVADAETATGTFLAAGGTAQPPTARVALLQSSIAIWREELRDLERRIEQREQLGVSVVTPATVERTSALTAERATLLGAAAGLLLGILVVAALDRFRTEIRDISDVELAGVRGLGRTPGLGERFRAMRRPSGSVTELTLEGLTPRGSADAFVTLLERLSARAPGARVVSIAGMGTGSEHATVAMGLALAAAQDGKRAILVDADSEGAELSFRLMLPMDRGFPELVDGGHGIDPRMFLSPTPIRGVRAVSSGASPRTLDAPVREIRVALDRLAAEADIVVVDMPSLPRGVGSLPGACDVVAIVVPSRGTTTTQLADAAAALARRGAVVAGAVVSPVEPSVQRSTRDGTRRFVADVAMKQTAEIR